MVETGAGPTGSSAASALNDAGMERLACAPGPVKLCLVAGKANPRLTSRNKAAAAGPD